MGDDVSAWASGRFGEIAGEIRWRVTRAIAGAHAAAAAAQVVSETPKRHPYGGAIRNTAHERLADELVGLPGVETRPLPGASHELVILPEQRVTLYPLRYANDGHTPRDKARIRLSAIRLELLGSSEAGDPEQLTFDHADLTPEQVEEEFQARAEVEKQLGSLSCVVIIGFASSPEGLHSLGWGEGSLGTDGYLNWGYWESLPLPGSATGEGGFGGLGGGPAIAAPVGPRPGPPALEPRLPRFDDDVDDDDLGISARRGETGAPSQEKAIDLDQTGGEEDQP